MFPYITIGGQTFMTYYLALLAGVIAGWAGYLLAEERLRNAPSIALKSRYFITADLRPAL